PPPSSILFPYTTLFRSGNLDHHFAGIVDPAVGTIGSLTAQQLNVDFGIGLHAPLLEQAGSLFNDGAGHAVRLATGINACLQEGEDRKSTRLNSSHVKIS